MSNRERPGRRTRKGSKNKDMEQHSAEATVDTQGFIYPEIMDELKAFYESNPAYHLDTLPIIYRTAQHQDDIDEALARMILLTQEIYSGSNKEVEVHRSLQNGRVIVTYIGLKDRVISKTPNKGTVMSDQNQTPKQPSTEEVKKTETTADQAASATKNPEPSPKSDFDQLWDKMAEACEKDGLPDMNAVDYTDSSILGQINALVLHDEVKGRHFVKGEHRMASIVAGISDPELVNMIPYVHHVGNMTYPEYDDRNCERAQITYDFGKYGSITVMAVAYDPARHPERFRNYPSVMRVVKEGMMADNLLNKPEQQATHIADHRLFASIINRVHLAYWAYKKVTEPAKAE